MLAHSCVTVFTSIVFIKHFVDEEAAVIMVTFDEFIFDDDFIL